MAQAHAVRANVCVRCVAPSTVHPATCCRTCLKSDLTVWLAAADVQAVLLPRFWAGRALTKYVCCQAATASVGKVSQDFSRLKGCSHNSCAGMPAKRWHTIGAEAISSQHSESTAQGAKRCNLLAQPQRGRRLAGCSSAARLASRHRHVRHKLLPQQFSFFAKSNRLNDCSHNIRTRMCSANARRRCWSHVSTAS